MSLDPPIALRYKLKKAWQLLKPYMTERRALSRSGRRDRAPRSAQHHE
jgi:hypothetical protein